MMVSILRQRSQHRLTRSSRNVSRGLLVGAGVTLCLLAGSVLFILTSYDWRETAPSGGDTIQSVGTLEEHELQPGGLLLVNPRGRHPIFDLIENAERLWQSKLDRQSRTLDEAVAEYGRRYRRPPPRGFDKWWDYVEKHNVSLPDEYDQILNDLQPFFAYSPRSARTLQESLVDQLGTFTVTSHPDTGHINLESFNFGDEDGVVKALLNRVNAQLQLLRGYDADKETGEGSIEADLVAATGAWQATFRSDDVPGDFVDWDFNVALKDKVEDDDYMKLSEKPDMAYRGWASACAPDSPLRHALYNESSGSLDPASKYLIADHRKSMSPCYNPDLIGRVGFLSSFGKGPGPQEKKKFAFSLCKTEGLHGDILTVPNDLVDPWFEGAEDVAWADKADDRVVWRDWTTGIFHHPSLPWRTSHRVNLVTTLTAMSGQHDVLRPTASNESVGFPEAVEASQLNTELADVGYIIRPIQCDGGACEEMETMFDWRRPLTMNKLRKYKYLLDIDGNGWSSKFKPYLSANSVVLKASIYPEWYMDRIQPWVHYVPVRMDMGDVYDILTFFRGDTNKDGEGGHDDLAGKIAGAGTDWVGKFWRKEDMIAYTYRLFLEYARLVSDDRHGMNFVSGPSMRVQE